PGRIDDQFVDQQRLELRVAILLDDKDLLVRRNEVGDAVVKRESAHAQRVEVNTLAGQRRQRLVDRRRGRTVVDDAEAGRMAGIATRRLRYEALGGLELAQQAFHVVDVGRAVLAVARVSVL